MTTTKVEKDMKVVTDAHEVQVANLIAEVKPWPSSVPDHVFQEDTSMNINYGSAHNIAMGQNNFQGNAKQITSAGGTLNYHEDNQITINNLVQVYITECPRDDPRIRNTKEADARACLTALFLTNAKDDRENLILMKGSIVEGTCEWIKTDALYKLWRCSDTQLLWLSGGSGKGRTMLSIFLAEELEKIKGVSFLQYFCDNKDEKRNTAVNIIRSLIFQLTRLQPNLIDHILPAFEIQRESLFSSSSFRTLWRIFEAMVTDSVNTIYCIVDDLDECDETSLKMLLENLKALFVTKLSKAPACCLKLIIVSRDLPRFIPDTLLNFPRIRLDVNIDIYRVIEFKVDELAVAKQYPDRLRVYVKEVFRERAQDTLLWVGIVADLLRGCESTEVEQALERFPPGLEEVCARMLRQIPNDRQLRAAEILRWVILAVRPLTLSELSAAVNPPPSIVHSRDEVMRGMVKYCGYFLNIQEDKVGIFHQSAKDYLLRTTPDSNPTLELFRIKKEQGNIDLTQKCLGLIEEHALAFCKVSHTKYPPLLSYAILYWPEHAKSLAESEFFFDLSLPFYEKKSPFHLPRLFKQKCWINKLNKKNGNGQTALHYAAEQGHEEIVRLLLENGAGMKVKNRYGERALHCAARQGQKTVVQLLLEKGADTDLKSGVGETALHYAAYCGDRELVGLLLQKGADTMAKNFSGETVLHYAALGGFEAVVGLLLEKGVDIKAKTKSGDGAALSSDVMEGIATEINAKNASGATALRYAIQCGNNELVRLLLENGADINSETNSKTGRGKTALHRAVKSIGDGELVQLLLEYGADSNAKTSSGCTALHLLAGEERISRDSFVEEKFQILVENGVNIEAKTDSGLTALHWLLLEKGVDVEAKDSYGWTAMNFAVAAAGQEAVGILRRMLGPNTSEWTLYHGRFETEKIRAHWTKIHWERRR
ncbi:hypothetical protein V493_05248 [Pseudogymnoascus sp. VKM F-4281 (FW-2241)]|nr:hypothetical protein V493_05248 [Pseudogymnoascus sp. VKM F-4281 (FW-2241)]